MRPLSTRSPSHASTAGITVTEPIIAIPTTRIDPTPRAVKVGSPPRNIPAIAIITVAPETSTARPEVAAAVARAWASEAPRRRSSRSRRR